MVHLHPRQPERSRKLQGTFDAAAATNAAPGQHQRSAGVAVRMAYQPWRAGCWDVLQKSSSSTAGGGGSGGGSSYAVRRALRRVWWVEGPCQLFGTLLLHQQQPWTQEGHQLQLLVQQCAWKQSIEALAERAAAAAQGKGMWQRRRQPVPQQAPQLRPLSTLREVEEEEEVDEEEKVAVEEMEVAMEKEAQEKRAAEEAKKRAAEAKLARKEAMWRQHLAQLQQHAMPQQQQQESFTADEQESRPQEPQARQQPQCRIQHDCHDDGKLVAEREQKRQRQQEQGRRADGPAQHSKRHRGCRGGKKAQKRRARDRQA